MGLPDNLRRLRQEQRFSQADLATATGGKVTAGWVAKIEGGKVQSPSYDKLKAVARVLKVEIDDLVGDESGILDLTEPTKAAIIDPEHRKKGVAGNPEGEVRIEEELILRYRLRPGTKLTNEAKREAERIMKAVIEGLADENKKAGWGGDAAGQ